MSRTVTVEVTAEDIAEGLRNNACKCPIARALARAYPIWVDRPGVFRYRERFVAGTYGSLLQDDSPLPPEAEKFVYDFDNGKPVEPFTFTVELP